MFKPYTVAIPKVRIGNSNDGGYVILDNIFNSVGIICYGVNSDISFDEQFVKRFNIPAYLFDHTVAGIPACDARIRFTKEGISFLNQHPLYTLETHVKRHIGDGEYVLKMDVEGCEWEVLRTADLSRVTQLIIELHDLNTAPLEVIDRINQEFYLVHIHGNNYPKQPYFNLNRSTRLPTVVECTWVRKNLIQYAMDAYYPCILDAPCDPSQPDLLFPNIIEKPFVFYCDDIQKEILEKFVNSYDLCSTTRLPVLPDRIFVLKPGDQVPYNIICSLDDLVEGVYGIQIFSKGVFTFEPRIRIGNSQNMYRLNDYITNIV